MIDKYERIFQDYKDFMEKNSKYKPIIVKYNTNTSSRFPLVSCTLADNKDTDYCTNDKVEFYESHFFTINIYTKSMMVTFEEQQDDEIKKIQQEVASEVINNELSKLTMKFFGEKLNMKKTLNKPTPNLDTSILRRTIQYQCLIGNVRGNIIRR